MTPFVGNLILAGVSTGLAAVCIVEAQRLSARAGEFPILLGTSFAVLGVMLVVRAFRTRGGGRENLFTGIPWRHVLPVIGLFILLALSVGRVGFYEASFVFAAVTYWLLAPDSGTESPLVRAARAGGFALVLVAAVYFAFRLALDIPTPAGILL